MLAKNSSLTKMNLIWNERIQNEGCIGIVEQLESNSSLRELNLGVCGIDSGCSVSIQHMLERNTVLVKLDISWNERFGDEGCIRMADALEKNCSLKELFLGGCEIGTKGAFRMGQMLEKNSFLLKLFLDCNERIGDEGFARIAEALKINVILKELDLRCCGLGDRSAVITGEMLEKNSSLAKLTISQNCEIKDDGGSRILQGLKRNTTLTELDIRDCEIVSTHILTTVESLLQRNREEKMSCRIESRNREIVMRK
eukprot:TRINITY_DN2238_c1_g1_i1.p1 TRINITY_DN2238_c1_g1~~TRINITY_DN2238_c1_g1_i1.p1  ORF type:complete len:255 (+),score=61.76 TRINITY_DN2238_c1_g1_i1:881-1645(+)